MDVWEPFKLNNLYKTKPIKYSGIRNTLLGPCFLFVFLLQPWMSLLSLPAPIHFTSKSFFKWNPSSVQFLFNRMDLITESGSYRNVSDIIEQIKFFDEISFTLLHFSSLDLRIEERIKGNVSPSFISSIYTAFTDG